MSLAWYGNQSEFESRTIGSLAVIAPLLERMNIAQIINQHLPADPQAEYDYGRTLSLLIAARLHSPVALSNVGQWAADSGADLLWGIPAEKLNDDRLGRALDALFQERHSIVASIALHIAKEFNVPLKAVHYDPTHLLFTGAYEESQPRVGVVDRSGEQVTVRSNDTLAPAHITKGRGTDDAPKGSMMVHVGLCTHVDEWGPLPFFGHTIDGNQNGRTAIDEQLALIRQHLRPNTLTMISDRGTFSVGHLLRLKDENFHAICSVPWGEFRELFDAKRDSLKWKAASYLSTEQRWRRERDSELPLESYQLAVVKHILKDEATKREIDCRVLFVHSSADEKVVQKQRQKQVDKIRQGLETIQRNVARRGPYSDEDAVNRKVAQLYKERAPAKYFSFKMVPIPQQQQEKHRTTDRGSRPPTHRFEFTFDEKAMQRDAKYDGYSAIVVTVPTSERSADAAFTEFKQQIYSEQVNRTYKGPLAVRPIFLHTPARVEALVFLMIMVLMTYYLLQRLYRQTVPADAPNAEKRKTTNTIFRDFTSYALLIQRTRLGIEVKPTRLTTIQRQTLQQLGLSTPAQVLSKNLPRPPT